MNRLEKAYCLDLEARHCRGEILMADYERVTFTLVHAPRGGKGVRYTPDFMVMLPNGEVEFHEIKGFRDEKNINKLKQAAEMFPFRFLLIEYREGHWRSQEM